LDDTSIASQRLTNQHIAAADLERPAEVVAWLGAIQAQDYSGGLWAVGGMLSPVIVIGGRVAGTWKRAAGRGAVRITPAYFTRTTAGARRLVSAAAERYGCFLNAAVRVEGERQPAGRGR
jgi:hypothetical protein